MSWEQIKFSELFAIPSKNGLTKPSRIRGNGFKMINMGELFAHDRIYDIPMELVPLSDNEKEKSRIVAGDLLFARQSLVLEGAGKCSIVLEVSPLTVFESHLIRVRLNLEKANPLFYYYYFHSGCSPIKTIVSQCAQAGIRGSDLSDLLVSFPPLKIQDRIADILSVYDDLIENNQKQIKLLEEAAQRLYKEWFIDLHFPGYEGATIIDGIPNGWRKDLIRNLIDKSYRSKQVMTSGYMADGEIPIIDQSRDFIAGYTNDKETLVDLGVPVIVFGDHTRILKYIQFPFAKGADGTQLIVSKCETMPQPLLYLSLLNIDLSNYHYARHFKYLKAEEITVPDTETAKKFVVFVEPIFQKVQVLRDQIHNAQQTRDRLLPKLMSGELKVTMDKKEPAQVDKFEYIRKHWQSVPYDNDLPLAARKTGDISEETLEKLKKIAEEE